MDTGSFRFERFSLDLGDRQLRRDNAPVDLNARYLDALALLVREHGKLVSKERFLEEVWRGVPVTDEALTQCIRTIRRQLGDDAGSPRFIETVPKHGYRFVAPVERIGSDLAAAPPPPLEAAPWRRVLLLGGAGTIGGGVAGVFGGLFYGLIGASQSPQSGTGAISVLLVLTSITIVLGLIGGAGVGFGVAAAAFSSGRPARWSVLGGAVGGMVVGAMVKLLGLDAFNLLFGQSPGDITGAFEGALLGGAAGLGIWAGGPSLRRGLAAASLAGAGAGVAIALLGGKLMGGSLDLLARQFPNSRIRLDQVGGMFGEAGFGPVSQALTGALEGLIFVGCVAGATILARRRLDSEAR